MAALVFQADDAAIRLGAATAVTGGAITRLLTTGAARPAASGDLLLAATLHTLSQQPAHAREFITTKRCASQRRELIRQSNEAVRGRHMDLSLSANSQFVLSTNSAAMTIKCFTGKPMPSERSAPAGAAQVSPAASRSCWHTCLALQSSLL